MWVELFVLCMCEGSYKQIRTDDVCVCVCFILVQRWIYSFMGTNSSAGIENKGEEIKELASFSVSSWKEMTVITISAKS